jgi:hypothetical protein
MSKFLPHFYHRPCCIVFLFVLEKNNGLIGFYPHVILFFEITLLQKKNYLLPFVDVAGKNNRITVLKNITF